MIVVSWVLSGISAIPAIAWIVRRVYRWNDSRVPIRVGRKRMRHLRKCIDSLQKVVSTMI